MNIILASASPFRKAQLEKLNIKFKAEPPLINEDDFKSNFEHPVKLCETLAFEKANSLLSKYPNHLIIGADQLVELDSKILGKPSTKENALKQLMQMSGKTHTLITSVCVLTKDSKKEHTDITKLTMKSLKEKELQKYIDFDNPLNCAGSYKIECAGLSLFSKVESKDHSAIIGLPMISLIEFLRENKIDLEFI